MWTRKNKKQIFKIENGIKTMIYQSYNKMYRIAILRNDSKPVYLKYKFTSFKKAILYLDKEGKDGIK